MWRAPVLSLGSRSEFQLFPSASSVPFSVSSQSSSSASSSVSSSSLSSAIPIPRDPGFSLSSFRSLSSSAGAAFGIKSLSLGADEEFSLSRRLSSSLPTAAYKEGSLELEEPVRFSPERSVFGLMDDSSMSKEDEAEGFAGERSDVTPEGREDVELSRKLFVGRIPKDLTSDAAMEFFAEYGPIESIDVNADRGCCFVSFCDAKSVDEILEGKNVRYLDLGGHEICVRRYVVIEKDKIFVRGLPMDVTREDLFRYFKQFGKITTITLHQNKGGACPFAFIRFAKPRSVNQIMARNDHAINGKAIHCLRAHRQSGSKE